MSRAGAAAVASAVAQHSGGTPQATEILWPSDANFIDVTAAPYNAAGDGVTNDTAAIRAAIADAIASIAIVVGPPASGGTRFRARCVYLPEGTYLISDTLAGSDNGAPSGNLFPGLRLCGAGVDRTTIKLANSSSGYGSAGTPKNVIQLGYDWDQSEATAFGNHVEHLKIEIGSGNPGAVALEGNIANSGQVGPLKLDGTASGLYGITQVNVAGSGYYHDLDISGFDVPIRGQGHSRNNFIFEDVTIRNPRVAALQDTGVKNWLFVNLTVEDAPIVDDANGIGSAHFFVNATISGTGTNAFDFTGAGYLYLRNISCTGYTRIVRIGASNHFTGATSVVEWASANYRVGETSTAWTENLTEPVSFDLPIQKFPEYHTNTFANWAKPATYSVADIQSAIDSGAEIVYFPWQSTAITIGGQIIVRGACRKLDFMYNEITGAGSISVQDGTAPEVIIENMDNDGIEIIKATTRPVSIRNGRVQAQMSNTASGEFYLTNFGPHANCSLSSGCTAWLRQWNRETNPQPTFNNCTVVMLGFNHESKAAAMVPVVMTNGTVMEALGGAIDCKNETHPASEGPIFDADESYLCVVIAGASNSVSGVFGFFGDVVNDNFGANNYDLLDAQLLKFDYTATLRRLVLPLYISPHQRP